MQAQIRPGQDHGAPQRDGGEHHFLAVPGHELGTPAPASLLPFSLRHLGDILGANLPCLCSCLRSVCEIGDLFSKPYNSQDIP